LFERVYLLLLIERKSNSIFYFQGHFSLYSKFINQIFFIFIKNIKKIIKMKIINREKKEACWLFLK